MENKYEIYCEVCAKTVTGISNYFCVVNRGVCENCLGTIPLKKIREIKKESDPFAYWKKMRRYDEVVDN